ncbi:MAG TPA: Crp/Fnr family transcriptional regulator [Acidimicrobiia bacterium]|nr:Crp/Fnr family transcriptional regulator [Acidimicrobiia bacterium]
MNRSERRRAEPEAARHAAWIAQWLGPGELAPVGVDDIRELAALVREDHYQAGDTVFSIGQAPTRVHIVRTGAVELSRIIKGRRVVLQILHPGDVFGDVSLFLRIKVPWDACALEESVVLSVDSVSLYRLLEQRPRLAWRWLHSVSARVHGFWFRVVELLAGGLEAQVASVVLRRAEEGVLHLSQGNLAELVGHPRTSINRALKHLESQGLVRVRYGQVEVLDEMGLAKVAGIE